MARQKGQWAKVTGGDGGAYFDGRRWVGFDCIGCMYARRILNPTDRLQLADVAPYVYKAMRFNMTYKHDKDIHNAWILNGKPI